MNDAINDLLTRAPSTELVLVDFYAPWCAPCKAMMMGSLPGLEAHYKDRLSVVKVNIEEEGDLAAEMKVRSIPHLVLLQRDGDSASVLASRVGMASAQDLISWVDTSSSDEF
jgi:thioredoxin 1